MTSARRSIWTDAAITSLRTALVTENRPRHLAAAVLAATGIAMTREQIKYGRDRYRGDPNEPLPPMATPVVPRPRAQAKHPGIRYQLIPGYWATPERVAVLRYAWPIDVPAAVIIAWLRGLPGSAVPVQQRLGVWVATNLGLKRTPAYRATLSEWQRAGSIVPDMPGHLRGVEPEPPVNRGGRTKKKIEPVPGWSGFVAPARPDVVRLVAPGTFKASGFTMLRGGARV